MAKRKAKKTPKFQLTEQAEKRLNKYLGEIRQGIKNVCELHKYESNASLTQTEFEKLYIDKVLAEPITAISLTIRTYADELSKQKSAELQEINNNIQLEKSKEEKQ